MDIGAPAQPPVLQPGRTQPRHRRTAHRAQQSALQEAARLPAQRFELFSWKAAKVSIDYHVEFEGHYYSVPHRLVGARLDVRARFPLFQLKAREVGQLEVGQVIHTGHPSDVPVELLVRGQRRLLGTLGQSRKYVGLRVTHFLNSQRSEGLPRIVRGRVL
jgi:hypothetical protein